MSTGTIIEIISLANVPRNTSPQQPKQQKAPAASPTVIEFISMLASR